MEKRGLKKKGLSPVVATTLLIAIVVVIALIIFLWFRGVVGDYGEKFGRNIELVCEDVVLGASYSGGQLYVTNDGNIPVFKLNVRIEREKSYETLQLNEMVSDWPEAGLTQGGSYSGDIGSWTENPDADEIIVTPVLIGTSNKGDKKTYACGEQYGYVVL
jgi:flagellin-like protein